MPPTGRRSSRRTPGERALAELNKHREKIQAVFQDFDQDGSGTVSDEEFAMALELLGVDVYAPAPAHPHPLPLPLPHPHPHPHPLPLPLPLVPPPCPGPRGAPRQRPPLRSLLPASRSAACSPRFLAVLC